MISHMFPFHISKEHVIKSDHSKADVLHVSALRRQKIRDNIQGKVWKLQLFQLKSCGTFFK